MNIQIPHQIRPAAEDDAIDLARLIDIAGEGIPSWFWARSCAAGQTPLDIGSERAQRASGGFSYKNALIATRAETVLGMVLSYPIDAALEDDPRDLPDPIAPFVALEAHSVGTWYINALAVYARYRGQGVGRALMQQAELRAIKAGYGKMSIQAYAQNTGAVRLSSSKYMLPSAKKGVRMGILMQAGSAVSPHPNSLFASARFRDPLARMQGCRGSGFAASWLW